MVPCLQIWVIWGGFPSSIFDDIYYTYTDYIVYIYIYQSINLSYILKSRKHMYKFKPDKEIHNIHIYLYLSIYINI